MSEEHFWQRLRLAEERVGKTSKDVMSWAIDFAQLEVDTLSTGDLIKLRFELTKFGEATAVVRRPGDMCPWPVSRHVRTALDMELPSMETVRTYQGKIGETLRQVVEERSITFHTPPMRHDLTWAPETGVTRDLTYMVTASDEPDGPYTYVLLQLLVLHGSHIQLCDQCDRIFLASRRNQTHCSRECVWSAATYRYREKRGLITGRPRGRPPKIPSVPSPDSGRKTQRKKK